MKLKKNMFCKNTESTQNAITKMQNFFNCNKFKDLELNFGKECEEKYNFICEVCEVLKSIIDKLKDPLMRFL